MMVVLTFKLIYNNECFIFRSYSLITSSYQIMITKYITQTGIWL